MCQKGTEWTFTQGLWCYARPYSHYALMKSVLYSVQSEWTPQSFYLMFYCFLNDVAMNTWTRGSVNTFGSNHVVWLLFFFFFLNIQLMIVFPFCKAACWRSFLYIMLTTVSSRSLIDAAKWQTELTDCLTVILRMMSPVDLFLDLTFGLPRPVHHHTRGLKDHRVPCTINSV